MWKNSAPTVDLLIEDAKKAAPDFQRKCLLIAKLTASRASFGPEDKMICKSKASMERKILQDMESSGMSEDRALERLSDALRGSIIASRPEQIPQIVTMIQKLFDGYSDKVVFKNFWTDEKDSGYVGLHAKILFPVRENGKKSNEEKFVIAEIQIHLDSIMNGSHESVKEREQLLYEKVRKGPTDLHRVSAASTLLYLSALKQVPGLKNEKD